MKTANMLIITPIRKLQRPVAIVKTAIIIRAKSMTLAIFAQLGERVEFAELLCAVISHFMCIIYLDCCGLVLQIRRLQPRLT